MGGKHGKLSRLSAAQANAISSQTRFTADEVAEWHAEFMRDCPKGVVSRDEFKAIFSEIFPFGKSGPFADYIFNVYDRSSDNMLTFTEFIQALSVTGRGTIDEKLSFAFRLFDQDRDGIIHRDEMMKVVRSMLLMMGGSDGVDSVDGPADKVNRIFSSFGTHDGLTEDEFVDGARTNPAIYEALTLYTGLV
eukprot:m.192423 g.192423  ORF g.192423 m.192423 type:complete len:191 (+) comp18635_c0_seq1:243-815(+)